MKKLFKLALFGALVAFAVKMLMAKKQEWQGLSEPEVRSKLDDTLGSRVPPEKLDEIQDKVVGKMREHGVLREEEVIEEEVMEDTVVAEAIVEDVPPQESSG
jgi:hypothetical protein